MLYGFVGILRRLKVDISESAGELRMVAITQHLNRFDRAVDGEYLNNVLAVHVACEMTDVDFSRLRRGTALTTRWRWGLGTRGT